MFETLAGARSELIVQIRENLRPENIEPTIQLIAQVINADVTYMKKPIDLRNQRTYAVKVTALNETCAQESADQS